MKGFLQGSLWGLVLGGSFLSIASLGGEQPEFAEGPTAPQLTVPSLDAVDPGPAVAFEGGADETPQFTPAVPLDEATDVAEAAPEVSTEPPALPETADVAAAIEVPQAAANPDLGSVIEAPAAPRVETALVAPTQEGQTPAVDTAPVETVTAAIEEDAQGDDAMDDVAVVEADDTAAEDLATQETIAALPEEAPAPTVVEDEPVVEAADADTAPVQEPVVAEPAAPTDTAEAETVVTQETAEAVETITDVTPDVVEEEAQQQVAIVTEVLPQTNAAVRINRPGTTEEEPAATTTPVDTADTLPEDAPALLRYGVPFEQDEATALIAIILVDEGQISDAPTAVADLGFVPTVAVNALSSASTDLAAAYREAGVEVAMTAELPDGAQPTDVEVAFEAALGLVPETAMLFSDGMGAMQDRAVTAQVMQILASDGYGFVTVQRGLSNAARAAEQADVSAATIQRDLDGAGEDKRAILRALDQAAFRARQTGEAVLLGRVTPATLDALREWAADVDRDTLDIAPVSAVLLRAQEP